MEPLSVSGTAAALFRLCFPSSRVADVSRSSEVPRRKHRPAREDNFLFLDKICPQLKNNWAYKY